MPLYDVSRTISPATAAWPGDAPFRIEQISSIDAGDAVNLTKLTFGPHTATHVDAPWHTEANGAHLDSMPLAPYIGPAHVISIDREHGGIVPSDFAGRDLEGMQRLLIHTWVSDVPDEQFAEGFPYPTAELADWLAARGVVLLGVDMPSVDAFGSSDLSCHHRLRHHGIANIELLRLKGVPDGVYELIALPLKLAGTGGSPVRAILRG
jgi:arylformamidase